MLAENPVRGCLGGLLALRSTPVVVVQSIEDGNRDEPSSPRPGWRGNGPPWNPLSNPLVWPCSVEIPDVSLDHAMKVPVPENQQVIEAFSPQAPQEPFADGVGLWSAVGRLQPALRPPGQGTSMELSPCDTCEFIAVFAVPVVD